MTKNIAVLLLLAIAFSLPVSGCSWVGRTAGKVQAKLERKVGDVESGYHQGYEEEKGGSSSSESTEPAQNPE